MGRFFSDRVETALKDIYYDLAALLPPGPVPVRAGVHLAGTRLPCG